MRGKHLTALALSALLLSGCAGAPAQEGGGSSSPPDRSGPSAAGPSPSVRVDWSRLERDTPPLQPDVDGGRWYPEYTDRLIPGENYGALIPYLGSLAYPYSVWEHEGKVETHYSAWPAEFYGLMTREGKIVVDPVYQSAWAYSCFFDGQEHALPVLVLGCSDPAWGDFGSGLRYAIAAQDGSWCTEFEFLNYTNRGDRLFLLRPQGCTVLDSATGARQDWTWGELGLDGPDLEESLAFIQWGIGLAWLEQGVCVGQQLPPEGESVEWEDTRLHIFDPDTGRVFDADYRQWEQWYDDYAGSRWSDTRIIEEGGQSVLLHRGQTYPLQGLPEDSWPYLCQGDFACISGSGREMLYRLSTGRRLITADSVTLVTDTAHPEQLAIAIHDQGSWVVYNGTVTPVLTLPALAGDSYVTFTLQDGLLSFTDLASVFGCYDLENRQYIFFRNLGLGLGA